MQFSSAFAANICACTASDKLCDTTVKDYTTLVKMMMRYAIIVLIIFSGIIVINDAFSTRTTFQLDEKFNDKVDDTNVLVYLNKSSIMRCAAYCEDHPDCVAFFINTRTRTCQGQSAPSNANMTGLRFSPGSRYYLYNSTICTSATITSTTMTLTTVATTAAPTMSLTTAPTTTSTSAAPITTSPSAEPTMSPTTTSVTGTPAPFICPVHGGTLGSGQLPDGFYNFILINDVLVDYYTAFNTCLDNGMNLPKIYEANKLNFYIDNIFSCPDAFGYRFWVDGTNLNAADKYAADAWTTHDGIVIPKIPELWASARPNNPLTQNCIQCEQPTFSYFFDDGDCTFALHKILCEKKMT